MRIALVTCVYPPYKSGIGNVAASHAHHLAALGHEVTVLCPAHDDPPGWSRVDGVPVQRLRPALRHGNSALVPQLFMRVAGFDATYIMYPFFGGAEPAAAGCRVRGIPYVLFFHMDVLWDGWRGNVLAGYERAVEPSLMRGAHAVLVSSNEYAESRSPGRIRGLQVIESPYSVDLAGFWPPPANEALDDPPVILTVGAMDRGHAFKGVPQLIDAFAAVRGTTPCKLVLVGDGELRLGYERMARATGFGDDISFLGRADDNALAAAYRSATVMVLPSTTAEEAFGVVLVEAMASGCPVVASDLPGVAAVARSGGGLLVPPGDVPALAAAVERVVRDPGLRADMSLSALEGINRYRPEAERARLAGAFTGLSGRA